MAPRNHFGRQRGAALVIGMILLAIITLLAVVGMNVSTSELQSASSEQLRVRAFQAAEVGIERAVIVELPEIETIECVDHNVPATQVEGGPATDQYALVNRYRGDSQLTDGFGKSFKSYHFSVVSEGIAPRDTRVEHHQGAYIVNHSGNQDSFSPLQANLLPAPCP